MNEGIDILIGTPGRIIDWYDKGNLFFDAIQFVVIDEADRMLDMGFEPQLNFLCKKTDMNLKNSQVIMTSATFSDQIQMIAQYYLKSPLILEIGRLGSSPDEIEQDFI